MVRRLFSAIVLCSSLFCSLSTAQDCAPPAIVANAKSENLFSPDQEMILGELTMERMGREIRLVRDDNVTAYLSEIGNRIAKHLPPSGLKFQFHLIDIPDANAFNIPGGHVFVSRKLVAFANDEAELAGVIAHELGHALVRHAATDLSEALRRVLNVTQLGDRKDIADKYNLLIERARTKRLSRKHGHENDQQLEADRIGLFAMVAAGYEPAAFTSFFDRLTETKGKTGNWLSDLFGTIRPDQKRLREMIHATEQLPRSCRDQRTPRLADDFLKWQASVVSFREGNRKEEVPGLIWKKDLGPKLRSDVSHLGFSQDGKLFLVQDDFGITVFEREPLRMLFQVPIEDTDPASFTPDGKSVVFTTDRLRFEKWGIEEKEPVQLRELVLRRDCFEHKLSPDGNYLACVDTSANVNLIDTRTGKRVWEKKEFYKLTGLELLSWLLKTGGNEHSETNFFRIEFSPDSRFVMFSRSDRFRFRIRIDTMVALESENTALALDLSTLKPVSVGGDLKKVAARSYVFLDSERVLGMPSTKSEDSGVFSFPDGKRLRRFTFAAREIERTANADYVVVKPLAGARMGIFDLKKTALLSGLDKSDAALWDNLIVYESVNGKILLREMSYNEKEKMLDTKDVGSIEVPVGLITKVNAAEVSNSFAWLLLSSRTRGGVWDLKTGERKMYVRGFNGGVIANDGMAVGDFPKQKDAPHALVFLNPKDSTVAPINELPETGVRQCGRFLLIRTSLKEKKPEKDKDAKIPGLEDSDESDLQDNVRFELKDIVQNKVIWSADFPKEAPSFSSDDFSGRLIFRWRLGSEAGKARLKESPQLQSQAEALGDKSDDYLIEVVDPFAKKTVGTVLLETGQGSFSVERGLSEGNWLVMHDSEGRVLVYSMKTSELKHRFFGEKAALNPRGDQIAIENLPGEITVYDLNTGDRQAGLTLNGPVAF